jgi:hypothetical protein
MKFTFTRKKRVQCGSIILWKIFNRNINMHAADDFHINPLKTNTELHYIKRSSLYREVNTLRLGYKNQSVNAV